MVGMSRRLFLRSCTILASLSLMSAAIALHCQDDGAYKGRKYKAPPPSAHIQVIVLRDFNGKPIQDAHVIFHPIEGDKDKGSLELKTDEDGKIVIDVIPIGDTVRLQIIADGYQTYGQDYKVDKPELSMEIRMKRPGAQYSVYKNSGSGKSSNATPPASGSQSPGSTSQPPPK